MSAAEPILSEFERRELVKQIVESDAQPHARRKTKSDDAFLQSLTPSAKAEFIDYLAKQLCAVEIKIARVIAIKSKQTRKLISSGGVIDQLLNLINPSQDLQQQRQSLLEKPLHELLQWSDKQLAEAHFDQFGWNIVTTLRDALQKLLRQKAEFNDQQLITMMTLFRDAARKKEHDNLSQYPIGLLSRQIEKHVKAHGMSEELAAFLSACIEWPEWQDTQRSYGYGSDVGKTHQLLKQLLHASGKSKDLSSFRLPEKDVIGDYINTAVDALPIDQQQIIYPIFQLCSGAKQGKPSQKFLKQIKQRIDALKPAVYKPLVLDWLDHLARADVIEIQQRSWGQTYTTQVFLNEPNAILMKGLAWSLSHFHDEATLRTLVQLAQRCYRKLPGVGPTAAGLGNACVYALAHSKGLDGLGHLVRLKMNVAQANTRKLIDDYLFTAAEQRGISLATLEDLAAPDFGLRDGRLDMAFEDYIARVEITGIGKTTLQWLKPDGSLQKTAPAFVKQQHSAKLKKLQARAKDIQKTVTAQRDRIDRSYIQDRRWTYEDFARFYLNHGLMSWLSQRLIWLLEFEQGEVAALPWQGQWQTVDGKALDKANQAQKIRLWHPILAEAEEVLRWRERLQELKIQQPFKQAYREVYLLTEAELNTRTYSNRMAAHILKQHQFNTLAKQRGWRYSLLGAYDDGRDGEIAHIDMPQHGLSAEYWINELYLDGSDAFNETGIWLYVGTDQVRFRNPAGELLELVDVPALVFSEIMRDVDLFVGVASVGNDPNWLDGGEAQYRDYWTSYSFGDLSEVAKTRKTVLESLLPRLKIRDVARIEGKFLHVKGHYHAYKIHIGSTNILMSPNDRYLCIVPNQKKTAEEKLFLPFEGDRGLSLIISKAFLLAADDKITDRTILSQIR